MASQTKRVALVVEGISDLARLILDAFERDDIACRDVLTHDGGSSVLSLRRLKDMTRERG